MSRQSGPRGAPRGVEHLGDRIQHQCDSCGDMIDGSVDETPWSCPSCGAIDREVEMYCEEIAAIEERADHGGDR